MSGRGRLIAKLKEKQPGSEVTPETLAEPSKTPPPPIIQETPATPTEAESRPRERSIPRGAGRGKLFGRTSSSSGPTLESGQSIIRQATSITERISPLQEIPRTSVSPDDGSVFGENVSIIQQSKDESVFHDIRPHQSILIATQEENATALQISAPPKLAGRGRGLLGRGSTLSSSRQPGGSTDEQPFTSTPTRTPLASAAVFEEVRSRLETTQITETIRPPTRGSSSTEGSRPPVAPTPAPTTGSRVLTSSAEESGGKQPTQFLSVATSSSMGKAADELQVEHLISDPPVKKIGECGFTTQFLTNYVKLTCKNSNLYQYIVEFEPVQDSLRYRKRLIRSIIPVIGEVYLFDGLTLFLPKLVENKNDLTCRIRPDSEDIKLSVRLTKMLPPEQVPPVVFNIIFKNIMKELKMSRIGQHYFSAERRIDMRNHGLSVWPGFTTAVHEFEEGLYLVIDVAHKVLRMETCLDLMNSLYQRFGNNMAEFRTQVTNNLVGNIVLTRYNNKTYRVDDIAWEDNPTTEFNYRNGERTSYLDYYKKQYGIHIADFHQPLLINRPKKIKTSQPGAAPRAPEIICLIPELCYLTGMSEDYKNDITIKKDLSTHTRLNPSQRIDSLRTLVNSIRGSPAASKFIKDWGLELDSDLATLQDGRILPSEKIFFLNREIETDAKCDWTRACGAEKVLSNVDITDWICVFPSKQENVVERFVSMAIDSAKRVGINIHSPNVIALQNDKPDTYYNEIKRALNERVQMILIVFPMLSDTRYTCVKKLCCVEYPVPSQVVVFKTINKPDHVLRTVASKVVLQMNVKLGGELWSISMPMNRVMIIGIDVYHKVEKKYQSIAGFVSSLNQDQTRWYSKVCFQLVGQELTDSLKPAFLQAIKKYQQVNNFLPSKIIIFRDGVSEGQLKTVHDHEVKQFLSCFAEDYSPQLSLVVVQKRINTRIFNKVSSTEFVNPRPGAIIDHDITNKYLYDYYLVSQHVNQGTVTPTHYVVVYDDTKLRPDHMQRLSYKMTHMYYNWSGTIRVPAPCQYAHKLAFLTGQYLHDNPAEPLCNRLFYL